MVYWGTVIVLLGVSALALINNLSGLKEGHVGFGDVLSYGKEPSPSFRYGWIVSPRETVNESGVMNTFGSRVVVSDATYQHRKNALAGWLSAVERPILDLVWKQVRIFKGLQSGSGEGRIGPRCGVALYVFKSPVHVIANFFGFSSWSINKIRTLYRNQFCFWVDACRDGMTYIVGFNNHSPHESAVLPRQINGRGYVILDPRPISHLKLAGNYDIGLPHFNQLMAIYAGVPDDLDECNEFDGKFSPLPNLLGVIFGIPLGFYGWWNFRRARTWRQLGYGLLFTISGLSGCAYGFDGLIGWNLCHANSVPQKYFLTSVNYRGTVIAIGRTNMKTGKSFPQPSPCLMTANAGQWLMARN